MYGVTRASTGPAFGRPVTRNVEASTWHPSAPSLFWLARSFSQRQRSFTSQSHNAPNVCWLRSSRFRSRALASSSSVAGACSIRVWVPSWSAFQCSYQELPELLCRTGWFKSIDGLHGSRTVYSWPTTLPRVASVRSSVCETPTHKSRNFSLVRGAALVQKLVDLSYRSG